MEFKDYYKILGVAKEATADEVKKAYRKLARKYHPDVSKEKDADTRMKEVNEAYAALSDPEKRAAYDQVGSGYQPGQDFRPPPGWNGGHEFSGHEFTPEEAAGFSDFFSEVFGGQGGGRGARGRGRGRGQGPGRGNFRAQGQDHHARVMLEIEDAFNEATRQITLRVPTVGEDGRVHIENRTLSVRIPRGVHEGQMIRLAGQGSPGVGGGTAGDLLLEVHFNPHPRYRLEGRDLHVKLPVAPWEAALGAEVPVTIPGSTLSVRVPAGAQSGKQLRVRGKGVPAKEPGELYLDLQVVLPPADTPEAKAGYETMAREFPAFDPRAAGGVS